MSAAMNQASRPERGSGLGAWHGIGTRPVQFASSKLILRLRGWRRAGGRLRAVSGPIAIAALVTVLLVLGAGPLSFIELRAFDALFALTPPHHPDPRIVIVDAGSRPEVFNDLRAPGDTPDKGGCEIPRRAYAEAALRLSRWGAKVIVFDLMFQRPCKYEDAYLARALRQAGRVVVAAVTKVRPGAVGLEQPVEPIGSGVWGVGSPAAYRPNETVRSVPLVARDDDSGRSYFSLSLLAFACFNGTRPADINLNEGQWVEACGRRMPLLAGERIQVLPIGRLARATEANTGAAAAFDVVHEENAQASRRPRTWDIFLINWAGPKGTIPSVLLRDVLDMTEAQGREAFAGKAVVIGRTDWDVHWTAIGPMPGPEVQANALNTLMSGNFLRPISPWGQTGLLLLFGLTTALVARRFRGHRSVAPAAVLMLAAGVMARQFFVMRGIWMYWFLTEASILGSWGLTTALERGKVTRLLARFVPSFIGRPEAHGLGEVRTMDATLLFSDIRRYSSTAEQLSAHHMLNLLNLYHHAVEDIITKHGGTVVKTPGDAILAAFWRDVKGLNHAACALRAGQEILTNLPTLSRDWREAGVQFEMGIGINAGPVAMGLVGKHHLEPTVIGDAVNVSQRLETLTKTLGYPLIFSESVKVRLHEEVGAVCLNEVTVTGRQAPIKVYGIAGPFA